jgi:acyl-CoA synthetase (AMP-forming)/AMP-acid ligase II
MSAVRECRYPREVEEVLLHHPKVSEASVIGKPDVEWGGIVVAFIAGKEVDAAEPELFCVDNIAGFSGQFSTLSRARFNALLLLIICTPILVKLNIRTLMETLSRIRLNGVENKEFKVLLDTNECPCSLIICQAIQRTLFNLTLASTANGRSPTIVIEYCNGYIGY